MINLNGPGFERAIGTKENGRTKRIIRKDFEIVVKNVKMKTGSGFGK
jgi:hypothetical protein